MYIYIYIYIHISLVRHGNRQDVFLWFPSSTSSNAFFHGFRRWLFYGFRRGKKTFLYGFRLRIFDGFCRRRRIQNVRTYRGIPRTDLLFCCFFVFFVSSMSFVCFLLGLICVAGFCYRFRRGRKSFLFMVSVVGCLMVSVVARNILFMVSVVVFCYGFRLLQDRGSFSDGNHFL